ncbi:protease complex subunit PrcB family protein [Oceanobacter kriegii]|uniref:protease complex subunit PrcB family protein n=1 Tax=Oceanobacter kriegii TaxID=64972 RepID=UPI000408F3B6|nr:protease complex subunit PrcB family protein [Oceanobacter kriegii]
MMNRFWASSALIAVLAATTGCATTSTSDVSAAPVEQPQAVRLVQESELRCYGKAGVYIQDEESRVRIALGRRPTAGYNVMVTESTVTGASVTLHFREAAPEPGMMVPQVLTYPCLRVSLPDTWGHLHVVDDSSGQEWDFYHSGYNRVSGDS